MIQIFPKERWPELSEIFYREFEGSYLPHAERSTIIADVDEDGRVKSFGVSEVLIRLGQFYNTGEKTREIFEAFRKSIPEDAGVIVIADQERYERLAKHFDMRHVPGKIYRRDF